MPEAKPLRFITEKGAFGPPGLMAIYRKWIPEKERSEAKQLTVESFVAIEGKRDDQMSEILKLKIKCQADPLFCSFTILEFVEETRPLLEPEPDIAMPSNAQVRKFGKPGEN